MAIREGPEGHIGEFNWVKMTHFLNIFAIPAPDCFDAEVRVQMKNSCSDTWPLPSVSAKSNHFWSWAREFDLNVRFGSILRNCNQAHTD